VLASQSAGLEDPESRHDLIREGLELAAQPAKPACWARYSCGIRQLGTIPTT